jgi:peptidoglycan hydrolase CwlO-like protein
MCPASSYSCRHTRCGVFSQIVPPPQQDASYSQIMEALATIQGGMSSMQLSMSSMQQSISTMQQEVHSINLRVEQNQIDLRECLKFHHPSSSDDEDDAPMADAS